VRHSGVNGNIQAYLDLGSDSILSTSTFQNNYLVAALKRGFSGFMCGVFNNGNTR